MRCDGCDTSRCHEAMRCDAGTDSGDAGDAIRCDASPTQVGHFRVRGKQQFVFTRCFTGRCSTGRCNISLQHVSAMRCDAMQSLRCIDAIRQGTRTQSDATRGDATRIQTMRDFRRRMHQSPRPCLSLLIFRMASLSNGRRPSGHLSAPNAHLGLLKYYPPPSTCWNI